MAYPGIRLNKPVRLIELFAGIGAQAKALTNLGVDFEHYRICEFDKYAVNSYNAIHGTSFEPSDITKIHGDDLGIVDTSSHDYILTYSFPCFTGDTLVLTATGYMKIIDIAVGDYVLTHTNTYQRVVKTYNQGKHQILEITGDAFDKIECTPNHKFLIRLQDMSTSARTHWVNAENINIGDYVGIAINRNSVVPITDNQAIDRSYMYDYGFWRIVGEYIGSGEIAMLSKDSAGKITHIKGFKSFVDQFGNGDTPKRLTNTVFDLPCDLLQQFIEGFASTCDNDPSRDQQTITITNRELIYGMAQCVAKAYGVPYRMTIDKNQVYSLDYNPSLSDMGESFYEEGYIWSKVSEINRCGRCETVYDIEVAQDNSLTANGIIVHNCQSLSNAGRGEGMEKGGGTRSGLLWEVERLLTGSDNLPQLLVMENVTQVHGDKHAHNFRQWCSFLESLGYKNYIKDMNAKNYGVAQNRNRCFMVSCLGDFHYTFPEQIPLLTRLRDYLEPSVDEKFYLTNKQVESMTISSFTQRIGHLQRKNISDTLMARDFKEPQCIVVANLNTPGRLESAGRIHSIEGVAPACNTCGGGGLETKILLYHRDDELDNAPLQMAFDFYNDINVPGGIMPFDMSDVTAGKCRVRRLTPREYYRLMGFSDTDFDKVKAIGMSNSQCYKQAGNSIVVPVLEQILDQCINRNIVNIIKRKV